MMKLLTKYSTEPKSSISMWKAILGPHLTKHKTILTREELATILRWKKLPGKKAMPTRKEEIREQIILDLDIRPPTIQDNMDDRKFDPKIVAAHFGTMYGKEADNARHNAITFEHSAIHV